MGDAAAEEKAALDDCKLRCWKESVAKELKVQIVAAPFRASYAPNDARSWAAPVAPHRHDPSGQPPAAPEPASPYAKHYAAFEERRRGVRDRYLFPATTCVEIKILRRVRADSSRRPPRYQRDACSMAWRCRFLTTRRSQHGRVIAVK